MTHPLVNVSRILKDHDIRSDDAKELQKYMKQNVKETLYLYLAILIFAHLTSQK